MDREMFARAVCKEYLHERLDVDWESLPTLELFDYAEKDGLSNNELMVKATDILNDYIQRDDYDFNELEETFETTLETYMVHIADQKNIDLKRAQVETSVTFKGDSVENFEVRRRLWINDSAVRNQFETAFNCQLSGPPDN
jgi:hypothetical protein